jgi:hypothetical protein
MSKGVAEFAAELEAAGCAIKWNTGEHDQRGFTVFARRNRQGHTVLVWFYNDVDQFYCAWKDGYQIRSMVGVRRALGLDWEM